MEADDAVALNRSSSESRFQRSASLPRGQQSLRTQSSLVSQVAAV
ncbi:MAG: hypothetical protein ACI92S_004105, partial [Planctomycetaceae bacterium]